MSEHSTDPTPDAPDTPPSGARVSTTDRAAVAPSSTNGGTGSGRTVEALEAELADWQRRAVMWRERALGFQELNEALTKNLEDLRSVLTLRAAPDAVQDERGSAVARVPAEQWWTKVFRRETWTGRP